MRRADHPQRIGGADVFDGRHLPLAAVDFDLELRGGEVGDLAAIVVERRDVDGHELDAGAKDRDLGLGVLGAWVLGCLGACG